MNVKREELRKVAYLDFEALDDRYVNLMPFWDGKIWQDWAPVEDGRLLPISIVDVLRSDYVAKERAAPNDPIISFVETMWQRASWPETHRYISAISADFHNLGTSIEKIDFFFRNRAEIGSSIADFVKTELEYIFVLSRSIFDLLHNAIAWIWNEKIDLDDPVLQARHKQRGLPLRGFHRMVFRSDVEQTTDDFITNYALHPVVGAAYVAAIPFFEDVRRFRDEVVHGLKDAPLIYSSDKGFCLGKDFRTHYGLGFPISDHAYNENLISLLPILAHVVVGTIEACNRMVAAFAQIGGFPRELAPGYRIFVRGPHNDALIWMLNVSRGGSPWWSDRLRKPPVGPPSAPTLSTPSPPSL